MVDLSVIAPVHDAEIGMGSSQPASISSAYMLSPTASSYFSPLSVLSPTGTEKSLSKDSAQSRGGSLAVRAMRSVRSMARIGGWGRDPSASAQPSSKTNKVKNSSVRLMGSGESWLARAPLPQKDTTVSSKQSAMVRMNSVRHSSLDEENRPLPTIKFGEEAQKLPVTASSASPRSSEESVPPRDPTFARVRSIDSHGSSLSRKSSGATATSYQAFPSIPSQVRFLWLRGVIWRASGFRRCHFRVGPRHRPLLCLSRF